MAQHSRADQRTLGSNVVDWRGTAKLSADNNTYELRINSLVSPAPTATPSFSEIGDDLVLVALEHVIDLLRATLQPH